MVSRIRSSALTVLALAVLGLLAAPLLGVPVGPTPSGPVHAAPESPLAMQQEAASVWSSQRVRFDENLGQWPQEYLFGAKGGSFNLGVTSTSLIIVGSTLEEVRFVDADTQRVIGVGLQGHPTHYLIGDDASQWASGVRGYDEVRMVDVYPGVDVRIYQNAAGSFQFDVELAPGVDPAVVRLAGSSSFMQDQGQLTTQSGFRLEAPVLYQDGADGRRLVDGSFAVADDGTARFQVGAYDASLPLIIDPVLAYGTLLGGSSSDMGYEVFARDGTMWIMGETRSGTFPATSGAFKSAMAGAPDAFIAKIDTTAVAPAPSLVWATFVGSGSLDEAHGGIAVDEDGYVYATITCFAPCPSKGPVFQAAHLGGFDAFVFKMVPDGSALVWGGHLGGDDNDRSRGLALTSTGVYVVGSTRTKQAPAAGFPFPVTGGFDQTTSSTFGDYDGFLTRISLDGLTISYSTYMGGTGTATTRDDEALGVAVEGSMAYVVGYTEGTTTNSIPTTATNAAQGIYAGFDTVRDTSTTGCVAPQPCRADGFLVKVDTSSSGATSHKYGTYLGATAPTIAVDVAIDPLVPGRAYVAADTSASGGCFVTSGASGSTPGFDQTFGGIADLCLMIIDTNQAGVNSLDYGSYVGGAGMESFLPYDSAACGPAGIVNVCARGKHLAVDPSGRAYMVGRSNNAGITPVDPLPTDPAFSGPTGQDDAIIVALQPSLGNSPAAMTSFNYVGGGAPSPAHDRAFGVAYSRGSLYVVGDSNSLASGAAGFQTTANAVQATNAGTGGTLDAWAIRLNEIIPLPTPTFDWVAYPSDQFHLGQVHPFTDVHLMDTTNYGLLEPGQSIARWTWNLDGAGTLSGTDAASMMNPITRFPLRATPYILRLTIEDNYGTERTSIVPATPVKPVKLESVENPCPVVTTVAPPSNTPTGDPVTYSATWVELDANGDLLPDGTVYDGSIPPHESGWLWAFGDGQTSTAPLFATHVYGSELVATPRVLVTDDDGCTTIKTFPDVSVSAPLNRDPPPSYMGRRPTADAGADQSVVEHSLVTQSSPSPCGIYRWLQVSGPVVTPQGPAGAVLSFVAPDVKQREDVVFHLVCNDGHYDSLPDEVRITVLPVNKPPHADAGRDGRAREGTMYTLQGVGSVDPEGVPLTYEWTQLSGPAVVLKDATTELPTFNVPPYTREALMVFRLIVHDGEQPSLPDLVRITIEPTQDIDFSVQQRNTPTGTQVTLVPQDSTLGRNFDWSFGDGATSQDKTPQHVYTKAGTYQIALTITQPDGYVQTYQKEVTVRGGIGDAEAARTSERPVTPASQLVQFLGSDWFIGLAAVVLLGPVVVLAAVRLARK